MEPSTTVALIGASGAILLATITNLFSNKNLKKDLSLQFNTRFDTFEIINESDHDEFKVDLKELKSIKKKECDMKDYFSDLDSDYTRIISECSNDKENLIKLTCNRYAELRSMATLFSDIGVKNIDPHVISAKMSTFQGNTTKDIDDIICPQFNEYYGQRMRERVVAFSVKLCDVINKNNPSYRFNNIQDKFQSTVRSYIELILIDMIISFDFFKKGIEDATKH